MPRRITTAREQYEMLAAVPEQPSLRDLYNHYAQWAGDDPQDSIQHWGNVETYLDDAHGLHPHPDLDAYFNHPTTTGMAKLHSMAQGKHWVDGTDAPIPDSDLLQGAALGLLKIRRKQHEGWYREAVPTNPDAQWGADVKRHIDENGGWGMTLKEHPGDAPTSGFMVSHPGEREESRSRLDPHQIRDYVRDRADLINSDPDNYYGGWGAPRTHNGEPGWYHDVSKNIQDPRDAAEMALKNNQQAVYDLDHDEEVSTPDMVNRATSPGIGVFSKRR